MLSFPVPVHLVSQSHSTPVSPVLLHPALACPTPPPALSHPALLHLGLYFSVLSCPGLSHPVQSQHRILHHRKLPTPLSPTGCNMCLTMSHKYDSCLCVCSHSWVIACMRNCVHVCVRVYVCACTKLNPAEPPQQIKGLSPCVNYGTVSFSSIHAACKNSINDRRGGQTQKSPVYTMTHLL